MKLDYRGLPGVLSNVTAAEAEDDRRAEIPESADTVLQLDSGSTMRPEEVKFGVEDSLWRRCGF